MMDTPDSRPRALLLLLVLMLPPSVVAQRCFRNEDCKEGEVCDERGRCTTQSTLPDGGVPIRCPLPNMVKVAERFCVDIYEASRVDATATSEGVDASRALSRKGVIPWQVTGNAAAEAACRASGKRLCTPPEWLVACQGPDKTVYSYGDGYEETTCNGIDSFGDANLYQFHLTPTGDFPDCVNDWGVLDINGNLWEHTAGGSDRTVRGGAYNCGDSRTLHRCDYIPGWVPSARGFRCCADGVPLTVDAGPVADMPPVPDLQTLDLSLDGVDDALAGEAPVTDAVGEQP